MLRIIIYFVTLTFMVAGLILGVLNPHSVRFDAYFIQSQIPLSVLLALFFVAGMLIGVILMLSKPLFLKWQNIKLKRQIHKQKNEISSLNLHKKSSEIKLIHNPTNK